MKSLQSQSVLIRLKLKSSLLSLVPLLQVLQGHFRHGFIGSVVPKDYTYYSINVLIIVVFGGLGSITGAIVSAIVLGILNMLLQDVASVRMIIYALALVLVMIFRPGGLLGTWELSLSRFFKKSKKEEQN